MIIRDRLMLLPLLLCLLSAALYLGSAYLNAGILAFPLDDAWIHQTYARTIAEAGEWAFRAGEPSTGSTSPLWTLLLVPGHWIPLSPVLWGYLLGIIAWAATVVIGVCLSRTLWEDRMISVVTGLLLATEWHLAWAALSGMEIPLYTALALLLFFLYLSGSGTPWLWGLVGGVLTLTRPEGILLLGLVGAHWLWTVRHAPAQALRGALAMGLGWLLPVGPYLLLNWMVSGRPFPNTFYAKQQEYGILLASVPLWRRLANLAWQPWLGGQALLLLLLPWLPWRRLTGRQWLPLLWALGIVLLYVLRLPVTYQHGRYLMPTIPVFLLYGGAAFTFTVRRIPRLFKRPLAAAAITGFVLFLFVGAGAYGKDVRIIECEMGTTARWVAEHSDPGDLIAAHDIGRLGYVTRRPILDFAGLISPETIPIIRNEEALLDLADRKGSRYLVTFSDWYPSMVDDPRLTRRHRTDCEVTKKSGHAPMAVYEIRSSE